MRRLQAALNAIERVAHKPHNAPFIIGGGLTVVMFVFAMTAPKPKTRAPVYPPSMEERVQQGQQPQPPPGTITKSSVTRTDREVSVACTANGAQASILIWSIQGDSHAARPRMTLPSHLSRDEWEDLKCYGDQAWNEYEKAYPNP
jgi:hypothetical protein